MNQTLIKLVKKVLLLIGIGIPNFLFAQNKSNHQISERIVPNGKVYVMTQVSSSYTFDSARYAVFIPDNIGSINGIFIHQHGCTMEGRGMATAYDLQYQAFAKKWNLVIVGPDLYDAKNNCHDWKNAESGSADALFKTLNEIAGISGQNDLKNAPWLLWGHSGGGYWAQSVMKNYPERVMAVFSYSPGLDPQFDYPVSARKIPIMIRHAGPVGDACCWMSAINTFQKLRSAGGYAGIVYTPFQNHNYSHVRTLAIPFFESILTQRLPLGNKKGYENMRDINENTTWLGDTSSLNIFKQKNYRGDKISAAWLPDSAFAWKWREFAITGSVVDRTPPPAPYQLQLIRRHNVTVTLSWKADADIESGIRHFNIYKGNELVARFPEVGSYQQYDTNGDDAYPLNPPLMQAELTLLWNDSSAVSVSTVGHSGLESPRIRFAQ